MWIWGFGTILEYVLRVLKLTKRGGRMLACSGRMSVGGKI
jgi:hypothetical protein